ncbi:hypothetical protein L204_105526 [Cryptococcus depauperatus]
MSTFQVAEKKSMHVQEQIPVKAVQGSANASTNHLDVEEELAFYSSYHSNKVNQIIHFICIPQILWTWLIVAAHVSPPGAKAINFCLGLTFQPNLAFVWMVSYMTYYILLDPFGGLSYVPVGTVLYLSATFVADSRPSWLPGVDSSEISPSVLPFTLAVHVCAWVAQFIGHGFFEHRAPALTDSLVQALVLAPFFVHLESLFYFFNYKPKLQKKIKAKADLRIKRFTQEKKALKQAEAVVATDSAKSE